MDRDLAAGAEDPVMLNEEEDCPIPSEVYLGQAPEIGSGHEADYERVS